MNEDIIPIAGFPRGALLKRMDVKRTVTYWRHLLSDATYMYVMEVKPSFCPKNSLPYERWELKTHMGLFGRTIVQVQEFICPEKMLKADFNQKDKAKIAMKWNMIAWIVAEAGDLLITDPAVRASYIRQAASSANVKAPYIRSLLTRHFYYGSNEYALMRMDPLKGAPGASRFNITKKKMGRPNDNVVLDRDTKFTGKNMTPYYLNRWRKVLEDEYVMGNKNVSESYEILVRKLCGSNLDAEGNLASYPIAPEKIPERSLFLFYGAKIIRELQLKAKKVGDLEWKTRISAQRGHTEDLINGVLEVYDLDGMEFNYELQYANKPIGKPLVMLAVARGSRAVVGWYAGLGNENGYAYRQCLFNAFTSKEERLERFGVSHLNGFVYGVCDQVMFDRGPGISLSVSQVVTKQLRIDAMMTSPRDAKGKSVVENVNGILQQRLSDMPGGYKRTRHVRDQDKHKNAESNAALTFEQFMHLLLCAINDFNLYTDVSHLLTDAMLKDGISPNPKSLFMWSRLNKRGDATYDWPMDAIYKKFLKKHELVAPQGIVTLGKACYHSDELGQYYDQWNSGPGNKLKSPPVTVYSLEETDGFIAWERDDGSLSVLQMMDRDTRTYADAPQWLHRYMNRMKNALSRKQRAKKARNASLSAAKEKVMREIDAQPAARAPKGAKRVNRSSANDELISKEIETSLSLFNGNLSKTEVVQVVSAKPMLGYGRPKSDSDVLDVDW